MKDIRGRIVRLEMFIEAGRKTPPVIIRIVRTDGDRKQAERDHAAAPDNTVLITIIAIDCSRNGKRPPTKKEKK